MSKPYSSLPNLTARGANGIDYAYRDTADEEGRNPLVLLQHFRGDLDFWDPALADGSPSRAGDRLRQRRRRELHRRDLGTGSAH